MSVCSFYKLKLASCRLNYQVLRCHLAVRCFQRHRHPLHSYLVRIGTSLCYHNPWIGEANRCTYSRDRCSHRARPCSAARNERSRSSHVGAPCQSGTTDHCRTPTYTHLIAHATDVHDVRIGVGCFEYGLHGGATGAEGHGRTVP